MRRNINVATSYFPLAVWNHEHDGQIIYRSLHIQMVCQRWTTEGQLDVLSTQAIISCHDDPAEENLVQFSKLFMEISMEQAYIQNPPKQLIGPSDNFYSFSGLGMMLISLCLIISFLPLVFINDDF